MRFLRKPSRGFTLAQLLVAGAMCAAFFSAAAVSFQAITYNQNRYQGLVPITINPAGDLAAMATNFGFASAQVNTFGAPSYGRAASAQGVYDRFWEDMEKSSAVFCLSRNGKLNYAGSMTNNLMRPKQIIFPSNLSFTDVDSHSAFLTKVLVPYNATAASIYTDFRNVSPVPTSASPVHMGGTVFMIQPYDVAGEVGVRAIYEIDLLHIADPAGVYASVRRYVKNEVDLGKDLSDYYDVFYEDAQVTDFGPLFVAFEKSSRLALPETSTDGYSVQIDDYKVGPTAPFFFMWWPDPAFMLGKDGRDLDSVSLPTGDVRSSYFKMGAKTSLMSVVPVFPSL